MASELFPHHKRLCWKIAVLASSSDTAPLGCSPAALSLVGAHGKETKSEEKQSATTLSSFHNKTIARCRISVEHLPVLCVSTE